MSIGPVSNVCPGDFLPEDLAHASACAEERLQKGFDENGNVGGMYSKHQPPPGKVFGGFKKGVSGVTWIKLPSLIPLVPVDYEPEQTQTHCIRLGSPIHCARGSSGGCTTCRVFQSEENVKKQWVLYAIDLKYDGCSARPVMPFLIQQQSITTTKSLLGNKSHIHHPYRVIGSFANEMEAKAYAKEHDCVEFVPIELD